MTPAKSSLIVASLASALLPPRIARALVIATLALTLGLAVWFVTVDRIVGGLVTEVFPETGAPQFVITSSPLEASAVHLPGALPSAPVLGDLLLASGAPRQSESGNFLSAETVTVLPLAAWRTSFDARRTALPLDEVHPAGSILAAVLLVLFAPVVLRVTFAIAVAGITTAAAFALWHLNAGTVVLPLPADSLDAVLLGASLVGLVSGWKAMSLTGGDTARRLGQHAAAFLLILPVNLVLVPPTGLPQVVVLTLLIVSAALRPSLVPAAVALPLLDHALDFPPEGFLAATVTITALRLWQDRRQPTVSGQPWHTTAAPFTPRVDQRGTFDFSQIVDPRQET